VLAVALVFRLAIGPLAEHPAPSAAGASEEETAAPPQPLPVASPLPSVAGSAGEGERSPVEARRAAPPQKTRRHGRKGHPGP
jgi:hypothetical protein